MEDNSKARTTDASVEDAVTDRVHNVLVLQRAEYAQRLSTEDAYDPGEKQTPTRLRPFWLHSSCPAAVLPSFSGDQFWYRWPSTSARTLQLSACVIQ